MLHVTLLGIAMWVIISHYLSWPWHRSCLIPVSKCHCTPGLVISISLRISLKIGIHNEHTKYTSSWIPLVFYHTKIRLNNFWAIRIQYSQTNRTAKIQSSMYLENTFILCVSGCADYWGRWIKGNRRSATGIAGTWIYYSNYEYTSNSNPQISLFWMVKVPLYVCVCV